MTNQSRTFEGLLNSVLERGTRALTFVNKGWRDQPIEALCETLLSQRGEASGVSLADAVLNAFDGLTVEEKQDFFHALAERFDIDGAALQTVAGEFVSDPDTAHLVALRAAAEPRRQELFRRLNMAPEGTLRLVRMRADLLGMLRDDPALKRVDLDFEHLFASWFNRGFLVLRPIDWQTPAHILEKIVAYEAVHAISDWNDLRRRLQPEDRRCFAFFHPAMLDEPLIFVEVALARGIPQSIQDVLSEEREIVAEGKATTAVFYSISNCQRGLKGVSFGNFLIKQVAADLQSELPQLKTFVTLSPIPGFRRWLERQADTDPALQDAMEILSVMAETGLADLPREARSRMMSLAADYFLNAKRPDEQPADPVARFHLGNGAILRQINWMADLSEKGIAQSAGMMVNYEYDLGSVEANHEAYAEQRVIKTTSRVRGLLQGRGTVRAREDGLDITPAV
jgi:malonyl-CoA decarboxylase